MDEAAGCYCGDYLERGTCSPWLSYDGGVPRRDHCHRLSDGGELAGPLVVREVNVLICRLAAEHAGEDPVAADVDAAGEQPRRACSALGSSMSSTAIRLGLPAEALGFLSFLLDAGGAAPKSLQWGAGQLGFS